MTLVILSLAITAIVGVVVATVRYRRHRHIKIGNVLLSREELCRGSYRGSVLERGQPQRLEEHRIRPIGKRS